MTHCSLAEFENKIYSRGGKLISFRVKRRYRRFLTNWAVHRFGAEFPPRFTVRESLIDHSYSDFMFFQGSVAEQMADIPLDYMNVEFSWFELLKYTFEKS